MGQIRQEHLYRAVKACHEEKEYPIAVECQMLHISRAAYHSWATGRESCRLKENSQLAGMIETIHMEHPDKGYRRINDDLSKKSAVSRGKLA